MNFLRPVTHTRVKNDENYLNYMNTHLLMPNREFGKNLTNLNLTFNQTQPNTNEKRNIPLQKLVKLIKPSEKEKEDLQKTIKSDLQRYNLRSKTLYSSNSINMMDVSMNSNNNSFHEVDKNSINVSLTKSNSMLNVHFQSEMDLDANTNYSSKCESGNEEILFKSQINFINPKILSEYFEEIIDHLKNSEGILMAKYGYMKNQKHLNEKMRAILIDWLVDVHLKYKLKHQTLYITINILERFLEKTQISRDKLQLVGVTSLFIASKYEEIHPPELKDFVYVTDNAYTKKEVLRMEAEILHALQFNITFPSSYSFFELFIEMSNAKFDDKHLMFAQYLLELVLLDYTMIKYNYSLLAASALYITSKIKKIPKKLDIFQLSGHSEVKLKECGKDILVIYENSKTSQLVAIKNKYSTTKFLEVSKF